MKPTLGDLFIQNCSIYPNRDALFVNGVHYTYSQLLAKVHSIYLQLVAQEKTYDRIGVYCTDDLNTYASILAASVYGAAFVPLNSNFPSSRNETIIVSASLELILNTNGDPFQIDNCKFISIENSDSKLNPDSIVYSFERKTEQELAYILFTSGSTGQPKGVPVSHNNVIPFFDFFLEKTRFHFTEEDRFIQVFDLTFDVSIFSFFMPLSIGACCYVVPQKGIRYLEIVKMLYEHQITVATMVPTVLQYIERYIQEVDFPHLRYSFFIGDKLSHRIVSKWAEKIKNAEIINFYGPTEATIMCTYYRWDMQTCEKENNQDIVPIGKPFPTTEFTLIDESNKLIHEGEIGELCLSGPQIIKAYLNNTHEDRFFDVKNSNGEMKRYYKTGDLARINSNGNLLFYGRIDNQVKINGQRIEINEIEENIRKLTNDLIHVACLNNAKGIKHLVLFIEKNRLNINFKAELRSALPDFMIPKTVFTVSEMPLNSNSKIDKKKLETLYFDSFKSL